MRDTSRPLRSTVVLCLLTAVTTRCAPVDELGASASAVTACPESVTRDSRGDPRNAAGQIRYCWPGEAKCYCDRDGDCYAQEGYVPCAPPGTDAGVTDSGVRDAGVIDTGVRDTGVRDTGVRDTGVTDSGTADAGTVPADDVSYTGSLAVRNGRSRQTLTVAGLSRPMTVYLPSSRGSAPPLVLAFHGTNGSGDQMFDDSGARAMADANGAVVIAPDSQWISHGDWDHATEETYWVTYPTVSPSQNPDLLLVRAIITEARRRFAVDPRRVYVIGHSNGGFFAELVATQLADRVAAYATSSAGLVRCATTRACRFQGSGTTCATLRTRSGWCNCTGDDKPGPVPASVRGRVPPAYLTHGTRDPMVSVQYTCELAARMESLGSPVTVVLRDGDGHVLPATFARDAWTYLGPRRLP